MKLTDEAKIREIIKDEVIANFIIRLGDECLKWYELESNVDDLTAVMNRLIDGGRIYNHALETIDIAVKIGKLENEFRVELRNIFNPDNLYSEITYFRPGRNIYS